MGAELVDDNRLSRIETLWSVVRRAHQGSGEARTAQDELLARYGGAIRRYLGGALRDDVAVDELYQEFALRFVQGDYASADPERGRFRAFLKTVLYRLVADHFRKQNRRKSVAMGSAVLNQQPADADEDHDEFAKVWREALLEKTWARLAESEQNKSRPVHTVMQAYVNHPELSSAEQAKRLSVELGRDLTAQNVRVILHRARLEFAEHLIEEVRATLEQPSAENLESELVDLRLHRYCLPALRRDEGGIR